MNKIFVSGKVKADFLIHIVDPDPTICKGLSLLFRLEGFDTTFSLSASHLISAISLRSPNLIIMDINMTDMGGNSLLRRATKLCRGTPVIMLNEAASLEDAVMAMKDGAADVLSKPVDHERLLSVAKGLLQKNIRIAALADSKHEVNISGLKQLTSREREVLQLIVNGMSNKAAGRTLGISDRTVEVHRGRVMEKLFARNTADLVRIVLSS